MAQHDYNIANQSGADFRADLNNALGAIATTNSGATEPSTTYAHQLWVDTSSNVLKIRNGTDSAWITTGISITTSNILTGDLTGNVTGNLTGNVTGNVTGDLTGNADTATTLATARTISLSGDVAGSASFDGSGDITITTTAQIDSIALGTDTTGDYVQSISGGTGVTVTGGTGEGSTPSVAIGQAVATTDNVTFNLVTATDEFVGDIDGGVRFSAKADGALSKGDVVYISGVTGNTPTVAQAKADDTSKMPAFGFALSDANDNAALQVVTFGTLEGLDTSGVSVGQVLYVSTTAGAYTTTKPTGESSQIQNIGKVQRSHASVGSIKVGGAGRSNDVPNLNNGKIFIGNASNQAVTSTLDTSIVVENTNLYFTNARVESYLDAGTSTPTFASAVINSSLTGSAILDDDTFGTASATTVATSESIKAYVDSQVGTVDTLSEILANGNTTGGNNILFGDNDKAIFGAGSDLEIYHDGNHSRIVESGGGDMIIQGDEFSLMNVAGTEYMIFADNNSFVKLYYDGSNKLATTSTGIDVTGVITTDGLTTTGNINLGDNKKAIFGDSSDLQIYHDGSNSYIQDLGTGNLYLTTDGSTMNLQAGSDNMVKIYKDAQVEIFHDASVKLATTATGIDVTGVITTDGLTTTGNINFGDNDKAVFGSELQIYSDGTHSNIKELGTGDLQVFGDNINFFNVAGSHNLLNLIDGDAVRIFFNGSQKLTTTNTGIDVTGVITTDGLTTSGDINFGDNDKAVFGAGSDLQIYHTSADNASYIRELGAGNLKILGDNVQILNAAGTENQIFSASDGSVYLYHNGVAKFETTSTGIDVTGIVENDGLRVDNTDSIRPTGDTSLITISGGNATNSGANYTLFGGTHATLANIHRWRIGGSEAMRIDSSQNVMVGGTNSRPAEFNHPKGISFRGDIGQIQASTDANTALLLNRDTSDGTIAEFRKDGTTVGVIGSQNWGIGTSSPSANLEINKGSEGEYLRVGGDNASNARSLRFTSSTASGSSVGALHTIKANSVGGEIAFANGNGNIMYLNVDRNVGIGTTPNTNLHIYDASGGATLKIESNTANAYDSSKIQLLGGNLSTSEILLGDASSATTGRIIYRHDGNTLAFDVNGSEAGRFTSTGTFLVGKTADNTTDLGSVVGDGYIYATRSGNIPLVLNRTTSDGTITQFRKDNSTYGSISNSGTNLIISGSGTNKSGLYYGDNALFPVKNGSLSNSTIGFGSPNYRFSNLYLSGSAYLADNGKAILGSGDDLQLFHNGANSFITNDTGYMAVKTQVNNGSLFLHGDNVHLRTYQDNQPMLTAARGGAVQLYHNNSKKFETTSSGITVHSNGNETYSVTIVSSGAYTQSYNQTTSAFEDLYTSSLNKIFKTGSSPTEALRIDSSQNVLIGTTDTFPGAGDTNTGISLLPSGSAAFSRDGFRVVSMNRNTSDGDILEFRKNGTTVGSVSVTSSATTYNTSSDARLKDVTGQARGLDVINALNPVSYNWKADGRADEGLIAQEVLDLVPNAVSQNEDEYYQMDYSKLVTPLIKAVQELSNEVNELKQEVQNLKGE